MLLAQSTTLRPSLSLSWKPWVIESECIGFRLVPSGRRTSASESGLLPTPAATPYGFNQGGQNPDGPVRPSLDMMARKKLWPTPTQSDGMGGPGCSGRDGGENLRTAVRGQLNADWVSVLMGYPPHWTEVE